MIVGIVLAVAAILFLYWFFGTEIGSAMRATGNNRGYGARAGRGHPYDEAFILDGQQRPGRSLWRTRLRARNMVMLEVVPVRSSSVGGDRHRRSP